MWSGGTAAGLREIGSGQGTVGGDIEDSQPADGYHLGQTQP
jgi:hypothetical protein